jgi:hypothetical protein
MTIEKVEKIKEILYITTCIKKFKLNFITGETDFVGKRETTFLLDKENKKYKRFLYFLNEYCLTEIVSVKTQMKKDFRNIETFWSNIELVELNSIPLENPKGFIKFCKSHKLDLSKFSLRLFKAINNGFSFEIEEELKIMLKRHFTFLLNFDFTKQELLLLLKAYKKSSFYAFDLLQKWIQKCPNDVWDYIKKGKTAEYIDNILTAVYEEKTATGIRITQNLYSGIIEGIEDNGLIVVIPHSIEELVREGESQNNCIGYYYNESIAKGDSFIFFIRRKGSLYESYITCRYNVKLRQLMEAKTFNNEENYGDIESNFLDKIVDILNKYLKED